MKKMKEKIKKILDCIQEDKVKMASLRDGLRVQLDELEALIQSLDDGIENLEEGLKCFDNALDDINQYV